MSTSDYDRSVLARIREAAAAYFTGEIDLDYIQGVLQASIGLFENDGSHVAQLVRLAEADVELIRFTRLLDEQRPATILRLDELLDALPSEGPGGAASPY